jgi:epoxyqueuosine reductase
VTTDMPTWLNDVITEFVANSPKNSLKMEPDEKAWDEVLVGFSSGADPIYHTYKDVVGESHWTPLEAFSIQFPDVAVRSEDLTVISWVLPQREATKADNRKETFYPSRRWVQARFPGEEFNNSLRLHVVQELNRRDIKSLAPVLLPQWSWGKSEKYVLTSNWSERHAAYAAGLGTFGLSDGLITPKGKAHRVGSVVANLSIPASKRAITESGHDKKKCWNHAGGTCAEFVKKNYGFDGYGCGLCQTKVPCESGIPAKILKSVNKT